MTQPKLASMKEIREFFEMKLPEMKAEWLGKNARQEPLPDNQRLTDDEKLLIRHGIANGTFDYPTEPEAVEALLKELREVAEAEKAAKA